MREFSPASIARHAKSVIRDYSVREAVERSLDLQIEGGATLLFFGGESRGVQQRGKGEISARVDGRGARGGNRASDLTACSIHSAELETE